MGLSRRAFLGASVATGSVAVLAGANPLAGANLLQGTRALAKGGPKHPALPDHDPLVPDPAGRMDLPRGFRYEIVAEAGVTRLESGEVTPGLQDGTGAFPLPRGGTALVNNHEMFFPSTVVPPGFPGASPFPVPHLDRLVYDPGSEGGCTIIHADRHGRRVREFVALAGTNANCAGGVTPWQTWITCEELELSPGAAGATEPHGYCFEVDPYDQERNLDPRPIKALGRFFHEAVAVDPVRHHLYLSEDPFTQPNPLFYRWTPPDGYVPGKGALRQLADTAGTLSVMRATSGGLHVDDLSRATTVGTTYDVEWVPVSDRDATASPIREQFDDADVTRAWKLEGMWWCDGGAYLVSSFNHHGPGTHHDGQVWFYNPARATITLHLWFPRTEDPDAPGEAPDNITCSPFGGLVLAEDGEGLNHLLGATDEGDVYPLARHHSRETEFAGPVFSPHPGGRRILYACEQDSPGTVFSITGPWRRPALRARWARAGLGVPADPARQHRPGRPGHR